MPIYHRTTDNRHFECAGLPWWSFGSRRARIVCRVSPIRFVPSLSMVQKTKPAVGGRHVLIFILVFVTGDRRSREHDYLHVLQL